MAQAQWSLLDLLDKFFISIAIILNGRILLFWAISNDMLMESAR